jgi:hypothetical protein
MSLSDPTSINLGATVTPSGGTATSFPNVDRGTPYRGVYQTQDGTNRFTVSHQLGTQRNTHTVRLDLNSTYTDPTTGLAKAITMAVYCTVNHPLAGFTNTQMKSQLAGLLQFLASTTNQDKILGLES